eukprot:9112458-Karenia_brevis.AAC.1
MVPSLVPSGDEDDEEVSIPSERDLRIMSRMVKRRERKRRKTMMRMKTHRCDRKCECDGDGVGKDDKW